jgi:predicted O-linked N-acetylglucosamine transferase (SPINDLY family)
VPSEQSFLHFIRHADPAQNYRIAKARSERLYEQLIEPRTKLQLHCSQSKRDRTKLSIGYLSNNFKNHPTAHLLAGLFERHDRDRFNVLCYSYGKNDHSEYRRQIESGCDRFVDIEMMDHVSAAKQMILDGVDILVDLVGFLKNHRMGIAALRPAPVQIRWLGMAGTSGASFYDYIITDEMVTPRDQAPNYSETFCYMPHTYQPNTTIHNESIECLSKKEAGLPEAGFVFGSFCTTYKIDETVFKAWMRILSEAPDSILWMLAPSQKAVEELKLYGRKCNVDPSRIVFAPKANRKTHLARLGCADLGLDTLIVNGAATTSEALWRGVPVLTMQGNHFASRMASSILNAMELPEMVVHSLDDYVRTAVDAANNPSYIDHLKNKVAAKKKTAPLFDRQRFVKNLEKRYEQIWRCHETGAAKTIVGGRDEE